MVGIVIQEALSVLPFIVVALGLWFLGFRSGYYTGQVVGHTEAYEQAAEMLSEDRSASAVLRGMANAWGGMELRTRRQFVRAMLKRPATIAREGDQRVGRISAVVDAVVEAGK